MIDRERLAALLGRERATFAERHPRSRAAYQAGGANLLGNVPTTWMNKAAGRFPVYLAEASGATVVDLDGHRYVDLCLGDTAAMAGHSPAPTVAAVQRRYAELGGATAMLPTEDAAWVGAELARRFQVPPLELQPDRHRRQPLGHPLARLVTGRPRILVFNWSTSGKSKSSSAACACARKIPSGVGSGAMILAIDQGTSGTTCLVFDESGRISGRAYREFAQHFPRPAGSSTTPPRSGRSRGRWRATRSTRRHRRTRAGRHRHHQPARDRRGLGPRDRRAAPPRDRLAGPPHRRALRRAARGRASSRSCASAPAWCSTRTSRAPRSSG